MLTLYYAPGASSMAPHIALFEVGTPFEGQPLSFKRNENKTPEYLAINPLGQVPTLVIDGRPLTEVAGILFYLANAYHEAGLLPDDVRQNILNTYDRARGNNDGKLDALETSTYCSGNFTRDQDLVIKDERLQTYSTFWHKFTEHN